MLASKYHCQIIGTLIPCKLITSIADGTGFALWRLGFQAIFSVLFSTLLWHVYFSKSICLNLLWLLGLQLYSFRIPSTAAVGIDWQVIICEKPGTSILLRTKPDTAGPAVVAENCSKVQFWGWGEIIQIETVIFNSVKYWFWSVY